MLVLNKLLQQANFLAYIRLSKVDCCQLSLISRLYTEKLNIEDLLGNYLTILI